jgi:uncharacterized DUF497 family protein
MSRRLRPSRGMPNFSSVRRTGRCDCSTSRMISSFSEPDEDRMLLTGLACDVLLTVCFAERGHRIRIISARKATRREQVDYNRQAS